MAAKTQLFRRFQPPTPAGHGALRRLSAVFTAKDLAAPLEPATPEVLVTECVQVGPKRWYQF